MAFREIIAQVEMEKRRIKDDIETNINVVINPFLERLKMENTDLELFNLFQHHLETLTSSFGSKISKKLFKLCP